MIDLFNVVDNPNLKVLESIGCFSVYEHQGDMSTDDSTAMTAYFMKQMNVRKRQLFCNLTNQSIRVQSGAMQWVAGKVNAETGLGNPVSALGRLFSGYIKKKVTGESVVKPIYTGTGFVMLEPTYKYILLEDVGQWGPKGIVLRDGLFLACDAHLKESVTMRKNISSLFAGHGLFNLNLIGNGIAALESPIPREELFEFNLENDVLKIDGNMAIAWSNTLSVTVERSTKSLFGSSYSGEGLLNVYRGTGRVLMSPVMPGTTMKEGQIQDTKTIQKTT